MAIYKTVKAPIAEVYQRDGRIHIVCEDETNGKTTAAIPNTSLLEEKVDIAKKTAEEAAEAALDAMEQAKNSASAAAGSATAAGKSASEANLSALQSSTSADNASASAESAATAASNASQSANAASASAASASTSADSAKTSASNAAESATSAASSATTAETNANKTTADMNTAKGYMESALASKNAAANSASAAADSETKAELSESWAVGGTGKRDGEDTNNSKYWAEQAAESASKAAGSVAGVNTFNGRSGDVKPQAGDYSYDMITGTPPTTSYDAATETADGLMSAEDKAKLDGIEEGANKTVVDTSVLENSANPVSGGSVYAAIKAVKDSIVSTVTAAIDTVKEAIGNATETTDGLMTTADKAKLEGIAEGATNVSVDADVTEGSSNAASSGGVYTAIKAVKDSIVSTVTASIDAVTSAIGDATTSAAGLMTTTQVTKLNGIAEGATKTNIVNNLTATTAGSALDAVQGKALSYQISTINSSLTKSTITPTSTSNISNVSIRSYKCGVVTILAFSFSASAAINSWAVLLTFTPPSGLSSFDLVGSMAKAGKFYLQGDSSSRKLQCDVDIPSGTWVTAVAICS